MDSNDAPQIEPTPDPEFAFINGWLAEVTNSCTCYGGGPYGHEPSCGTEPIVNISQTLKSHEKNTVSLFSQWLAKEVNNSAINLLLQELTQEYLETFYPQE